MNGAIDAMYAVFTVTRIDIESFKKGRMEEVDKKLSAAAQQLKELGIHVEGADEDTLLELTMDSGAEDLKNEEDAFEIITAVEDLESVKKALDDFFRDTNPSIHDRQFNQVAQFFKVKIYGLVLACTKVVPLLFSTKVIFNRFFIFLIL